MIGRLAAEVLRAAIRDGAVVGIGDGASISAVADAIAADEPLHETGATVVPLCGGYWFGGPAREPFRRVADGIGGVAARPARAGPRRRPGDEDVARAPTPASAGSSTSGTASTSRPSGSAGRPGARPRSAADVAGELDRAGAVGEVLVSPFDLDGTFVCDALRERTIAFDARELRRVPVRIGVAGGPRKVRPILGALRGGLADDARDRRATAEAVVALDDGRPCGRA